MKSLLPILGWAVAGLALLASFRVDFAHHRRGGIGLLLAFFHRKIQLT